MNILHLWQTGLVGKQMAKLRKFILKEREPAEMKLNHGYKTYPGNNIQKLNSNCEFCL